MAFLGGLGASSRVRSLSNTKSAGRPGLERWSSGLALFPGESTGELSSFVEAAWQGGRQKVTDVYSIVPGPCPGLTTGTKPIHIPLVSFGALVLNN